VNPTAHEAEIRAGRHHDKWSILRRATNGQGVGGAAQFRAAYAESLEQAGAVELAKFAQQAVDTGDVRLADAVIRENDNRNLDNRSFSSTAVLAALLNAEHATAQQLLQNVIDPASEVGLAWSEFERDRPDGCRRIAAGLAKQARIKEGGPATGELQEDGSVV